MAYTVEDWYETTVAVEFTDSGTELQVTSLPTSITSGIVLIGDDDNRENWEKSYFSSTSTSPNRLVFTGLTNRGLIEANTTVTDSLAANRKTHVAGTKVRLIDASYLFNNKADTNRDNTFTETIRFSGAVKVPVYTDVAALNAAIPSPEAGMEVYLSASGAFYDYIGSVWSQRENDASDDVKVKVSNLDTTGDYLADKIVAGDGISETDSGAGDATLTLDVDLATDPGLEFDSNALRVKVKSGGGITRDSDGLSVSDAYESKFIGDGSDGAVDGSSNITITGSNNTLITKEYTSWAAAQGGGKTVTITPTGCVTTIKIKGDADFTDWTFDFTGKGMPGVSGGNGGSGGDGNSSGGVNGSNGAIGTAGNVSTNTSSRNGLTAATAGTSGGGGGAGGAGGTGGGGGGSAGSAGSGCSISTNGTNGTSGNTGSASDGSAGAAGTAGNGATNTIQFSNTSLMEFERRLVVFVGSSGAASAGSGGGGGGGGESGNNGGDGGAGGSGGDGGSGGGCLIIQVGGNITGTASMTVNCNGADGGDGGDGVNGQDGQENSAPGARAGGGGGGGAGSGGSGGSGGTFILLYNGSIDGSPIIDVTGGGAGSAGTAGTGGTGINGAANGGNGAAGIAGKSGAAGTSYVAKNNFL